MSNTRTYSISSFVNGYDAGQVYNIVSISGLSQPIVNLTDDSVDCTMEFAGNLVSGDDTILNNILATFTPIYGDGSNCWIFQHTEASNVSGGSLTSGQWNTRTINSTLNQNGQPVQRESGNSKLAVFPGNYEFYIHGVTAGVDNYQIRLQNLTNSTTIFQGESNNAGANNSTFFMFGWFALANYSEIEVQQYCHTSNSNGMGIANVDGLPNLYLQIKLLNA